tara:strand:- start:32 stop:322 length:291 start_codon:yes stop_codon:yes gene_type:complete
MALTKTQENDKIEVTQRWNVGVRCATVIKDDGVEISRSFNRKVLKPGTLDASDNLVDTDLSGEDADVKAIAEAAWTTQVKADFKAFLIANKDTTPS